MVDARKADQSRGEGQRRVLSALLLLIPVIFSVLYDLWSFLALLVVVLVTGLLEWNRMTLGKFDPPRDILSALLLTAVLVSALFHMMMAWVVLASAMIVVSIVYLRQASWFWAVIGMAYLALPGLALLMIWDQSFEIGCGAVDGKWMVLWLIAIVAACDTGAYAMGKTFEGAKLSPKISPGKTWAGLYGGVIAAVVIAGCFSLYAPLSDQQRLLSMVLAILVALSGQMGDAMESAVKRRFSRKDSSHLIPGHGGVLDRCDSFVLAAPVTLFLLWIFEGAL